jgi:acyl-CoA oxidase
MRGRLGEGVDSFQAVNEIQDHLLTLARAHVERVVLEAFQDGCAAAPTPGLSELLSETCALFALSRIEADRGWFLEAGYLEPAKSRAIRSRVNILCGTVSDAAETLVAGFGIPETLLPAIATPTSA